MQPQRNDALQVRRVWHVERAVARSSSAPVVRVVAPAVVDPRAVARPVALSLDDDGRAPASGLARPGLPPEDVVGRGVDGPTRAPDAGAARRVCLVLLPRRQVRSLPSLMLFPPRLLTRSLSHARQSLPAAGA